ncbi:lysophospholipid acyltransferase family protein [Xinfangfangia sp. CPCC 101601]|uniref:Lysophospholipid acyltransferase family protein n=1 Tax=Pseudogemmobacter lacusdianii TaxID=3069608 RepID=A0ABU0W2C1_9RHOB|nr:lysophospholipid acyltransferase family protein [Xinfangfangia sp. CPCC 101601]MDQ2068165.1 lysophospholipid acyltransferase family protein [Xinfangfangia sp. CPCC 101601]
MTKVDWQNAPAPAYRAGPLGWLRGILRGLAMALVTYLGLAVLLVLRLIERPLFGAERPITPHITRFVCRANCAILGLRRVIRGKPMAQKGAVVANHSSWIDIFTLNASDLVYFVAKAEVSGWPGIGWLAQATGTVFIRRRGVEAKLQQDLLESRLRQGHRLLFFPEGTSTDAIRVLPFKSSLFQAFFTHGLDRVLYIQPVTVVYHAPEGQDPRFYGWWGEMDFAGHLWKMLTAPKHGTVEITFHPEVPVDGFEDRKSLAQYCERVIRTNHRLAQH